MATVNATHRWQLPEPHSPAAAALAVELGLPVPIAQLLLARGFADGAAARLFLESPAANLRPPLALPDITAATERLVWAAKRRERILVCGDYDVDGIAGTALLVSALTKLGCPTDFFIPRRDIEGYGFPVAGVEYARSTGSTLIVTTDCGSGDAATITAARAAGIDVIITDHHEIQPGNVPPAAVAFVNPKRLDSSYPFRELAGAGVAFKVMWSLLAALKRPREELIGLIDLAGLGTICDVVPLVDENRILARLALGILGQQPRPGIRALLNRAGVRTRRLSRYHAGFIIGPRLNAAGRVGHAAQAVRLLLHDDTPATEQIAAELDTLNRLRQAIEERTLREAIAKIEAERLAAGRTIVVSGNDWHNGVIGIVASRLAERYCRPAVVVSFRDDLGRGSARSVPNFDLHAALHACGRYLISYGGHRQAAGLTTERRQLESFRDAFEQHAASYPEAAFVPHLQIDALLAPATIDAALLRALDRLEPFGPNNPLPLFASLGIEIADYPRRIGRDHLLIRIQAGPRVIDGIAWRRGNELTQLTPGLGNKIDICYTIDRSDRNGQLPRLNIVDLRSSSHS